MGTAQDLWANCPAGSRLLVTLYPALSISASLLAAVVPAAQLAVHCAAATVVGKGYVWTLLTAFLVTPLTFGPAIIFFCLELYMALSLLAPRERVLGSAAFLAWTTIISTLVNTVFVGMTFGLSFLDPEYALLPIQGMWPIIIVSMTVQCLAKPLESASFWGVVSIPNKWYPLFLASVFSLFSGRIMWDFVAALSVGYAHDRLGLQRAVEGRSWVAALERCLSRLITRLTSGPWVPAGGAPEPGDVMEAGGGGGSVFRRGGARKAPAEAQQPSFRAFGGSGQKLGGR